MAGIFGISIRGIRKVYGDIVAVDDLSLEIEGRGIFALLGPNGAGKSTTLGMISGLIMPDAGTIDYRGASGNCRQELIGLCPQAVCIWPNLTCLEQLIFIGGLYGFKGRELMDKSKAVLGDLGLSEKAHCLARTLSGGMQRRLNLALALINDPEVLILDEPEAGLDSQSRVLVREYVKDLATHKCVILTTHDMDEADRMADRVGIMDHGRLLAKGTPEELKRLHGQGDLIEMEFSDSMKAKVAKLALEAAFPDIVAKDAGGSVEIRVLDAMNRLPGYTAILHSEDIAVKSLGIRSNSLEDVFLSFTGRGLRE